MSGARGIDLTGLTVGPAQTWGAVRLVPLLRSTPIVDLRLHPRLYDGDELSAAEVGADSSYVAFVPHAFVATWTHDGNPSATYGTQLRSSATPGQPEGIDLHFRRRMARREDHRRLRFLPLHVAMEGYLAMQFGGPAIGWQEWTRQAVTRGLRIPCSDGRRSAGWAAAHLDPGVPDGALHLVPVSAHVRPGR